MVEIFWTVAAFAVGVLSAARLTRLVIHDSFPPSVWFRIRWDDVTKRDGEANGWNPLFHCHWCLSPWMALIVLSWGWLSNTDGVWWFINLFLAGGYLAGMIVERDEAGDA